MKKHLAISFALLMLSAPAFASELRQQFINPSFGGYSGNGTYLQSVAAAQNNHSAPTTSPNAQQTFSQTITNSLLNRIALNISDQITSAANGTSSSFHIDDTVISYSKDGSGLTTVTITDTTTGQSTTISF